MIFPDLFADQFRLIDTTPNATRSNRILIPIHSAIAKIISENTSYKVISLPDSEYQFKSDIGSKKIDIAIVDEEDNLKGAIMFKAIRSEYNKNANNYYESMKGESSLFLDNDIPVYQIIFIPTQVKRSRGGYETPTEKSYCNYCNFINSHKSYWDNLKLGVFYFDIDYDYDYEIFYSDKVVPGVEDTLTEGLINFIEGVNNNG